MRGSSRRVVALLAISASLLAGCNGDAGGPELRDESIGSKAATSSTTARRSTYVLPFDLAREAERRDLGCDDFKSFPTEASILYGRCTLLGVVTDLYTSGDAEHLRTYFAKEVYLACAILNVKEKHFPKGSAIITKARVVVGDGWAIAVPADRSLVWSVTESAPNRGAAETERIAAALGGAVGTISCEGSASTSTT